MMAKVGDSCTQYCESELTETSPSAHVQIVDDSLSRNPWTS